MTIQRLIEFVGHHPVLIAAFAAVLTFIVINEVRRKSNSREIGVKDAVRMINDENALVLDIREPGDYKAGHIINAKNIPYSRLNEETAVAGGDKDRPIIVYCKSGTNSPAACDKLLAAGYTRVHCLKNGLSGWREENLPVEK
jgi:rhodanese-related sulfurtransferase